jgi:hypothetical protein
MAYATTATPPRYAALRPRSLQSVVRKVNPVDDATEQLFDILRDNDALAGKHYGAHLIMFGVPRRYFAEIRRMEIDLRRQGMVCEVEESSGWFSKDFTVRCDDAALLIWHELGDRIRLKAFH